MHLDLCFTPGGKQHPLDIACHGSHGLLAHGLPGRSLAVVTPPPPSVDVAVFGHGRDPHYLPSLVNWHDGQACKRAGHEGA